MIKDLSHNMLHYFILKFIFNLKLQKEIEQIINQTAVQLVFIDFQKQFTKNILARLLIKYKKK
jgi:hypothetical protein